MFSGRSVRPLLLADAVHVELHIAAALAEIDVERLLVDEQLAEIAEQAQRVPSWNFLVPA